MSALDSAAAIAYRLASVVIEDVGVDFHEYADWLGVEDYGFVMDHQDEVAAALRGISNDLANKVRHADEGGESS